jgi:tRNA G18 (ribose-2'-O)-methylase SpoU
MPLVPPLDASPDEVRQALAPLRHDFSVALHSFGNAFAAGAVIRVAHSFLAREIIVIGREPFYAKASMGMEKYETVLRVESEEAFFEAVRGRPVWAIEKDHARRSLNDIGRFPAGVVFVFGSERAGLSASFVERADEVVGIPMYGVNHSFPVAVAAGIVMHEWARRRYAEGRPREEPNGSL